MAITRLSLDGYGARRAGSFAGKTASAPTGVMRFNLTPRIYRMLYYNQWS